MKIQFKKYIKIDPLKSFIELPILWLVIIILFIIALIIAIIIINNSKLIFAPDYNGWNSLLEIFKVPLGILAIAITYSAFIATIHRSVQTKEQLKITNIQNTFSNYYKHIEEFEKYCHSAFADVIYKSVFDQSPREMHKYLFPKAIDGDYIINKELIANIRKEYPKIVIELNKFSSTNINKRISIDIFNKIYLNIQNIFAPLGMNLLAYNTIVFSNENGEKILIPNGTLNGGCSLIIDNSQILKKILLFDHSVEFPESFNNVTNINLAVIPNQSIEHLEGIAGFNVISKSSK